MGMSIDAPFIAHSELTNEIYIINKKDKYCVTDQVIKAVESTNRAIPKADYETRLKADLVAMLEELKSEFEENVLADDPNTLLPFLQARETCIAIIQQKINSLKENNDGSNN